MSEFSESYHLRSERTEDAVELLQRASLKGYVYPSANGWVTFVVENENFIADPNLAGAASQPLLHYTYAEDHGWGFTVFEGGKPVSAYDCGWDDEIVFNISQYAQAPLLKFISPEKVSEFEEFDRRIHPEDVDELYEDEIGKLFAEALNLPHYDWLSFRGVHRDFDPASEYFEGVQMVK